MAWNQPGNNGQDNDPWGSNKKKTTNSSGNFFDKLNGFLKKGPSGNGDNGSGQVKLPISLSFIVGAVILVIIVIWAESGFYTVGQNQRGVITRFGQVQPAVVNPGLNWNPPLIDKVYLADTEGTKNFNVQGFMITAGENLVFVTMNVQYRIESPIKYFFNVTNVDDSLRQAADSALRTVVGSSSMDAILTDGRSSLEDKTREELINVITNYDMGISIRNLSFQSARPPEEVQDAFNDAIKAREDREREINKAEADRVEFVQGAEGRAARILADANAYRVRVELEAQGDVSRFEKLLPQYKAAPEITRERLYIETMEKVLSSTNKVLVNDKSGNLLVLPLDQMLKGNKGASSSNNNSSNSLNSGNGYSLPNSSSTSSGSSTSGTSSNNSNENRSNNNTTRGSSSINTTRSLGR